jgi:hypothetical protein
MRVCFKMFQGMFRSWDQLFRDAAIFATELGPERLICISHSQSETVGTVTVWYWDEGKL